MLTGASSGIGYQTAEDLAGQGHIVYGGQRKVSHELYIICQQVQNRGGYDYSY